ncbi:hypothetical protein C8F01DRAFT_1092142 [Mycena amicta]|nr:hypothetical protein C8F01DRAFT_1092142 [Mycena amicta]
MSTSSNAPVVRKTRSNSTGASKEPTALKQPAKKAPKKATTTEFASINSSLSDIGEKSIVSESFPYDADEVERVLLEADRLAVALAVAAQATTGATSPAGTAVDTGKALARKLAAAPNSSQPASTSPSFPTTAALVVNANKATRDAVEVDFSKYTTTDLEGVAPDKAKGKDQNPEDTLHPFLSPDEAKAKAAKKKAPAARPSSPKQVIFSNAGLRGAAGRRSPVLETSVGFTSSTNPFALLDPLPSTSSAIDSPITSTPAAAAPAAYRPTVTNAVGSTSKATGILAGSRFSSSTPNEATSSGGQGAGALPAVAPSFAGPTPLQPPLVSVQPPLAPVQPLPVQVSVQTPAQQQPPVQQPPVHQPTFTFAAVAAQPPPAAAPPPPAFVPIAIPGAPVVVPQQPFAPIVVNAANPAANAPFVPILGAAAATITLTPPPAGGYTRVNGWNRREMLNNVDPALANDLLACVANGEPVIFSYAYCASHHHAVPSDSLAGTKGAIASHFHIPAPLVISAPYPGSTPPPVGGPPFQNFVLNLPPAVAQALVQQQTWNFSTIKFFAFSFNDADDTFYGTLTGWTGIDNNTAGEHQAKMAAAICILTEDNQRFLFDNANRLSPVPLTCMQAFIDTLVVKGQTMTNPGGQSTRVDWSVMGIEISDIDSVNDEWHTRVVTTQFRTTYHDTATVLPATPVCDGCKSLGHIHSLCDYFLRLGFIPPPGSLPHAPANNAPTPPVNTQGVSVRGHGGAPRGGNSTRGGAPTNIGNHGGANGNFGGNNGHGGNAGYSGNGGNGGNSGRNGGGRSRRRRNDHGGF